MTRYHRARGPLTGIRVLEFKGIGPGPFCGMMLADMEADVLLVDRQRSIEVLVEARPVSARVSPQPQGKRGERILLET